MRYFLIYADNTSPTCQPYQISSHLITFLLNLLNLYAKGSFLLPYLTKTKCPVRFPLRSEIVYTASCIAMKQIKGKQKCELTCKIVKKRLKKQGSFHTIQHPTLT